ncbi:FAD-linked oxidoreductase-like protein [Fusarium sp. MPI-SDFR-AT-0072]|nr:FAD-linked oxidoreductase-like protein [Fusarium sp. MPI-SDFR-AT-0072]
MEAIASKARDNNVRIVIDAEQSWYQPDGPATCIASFQAYLRRYPQLLDQQIARAGERGYKLLVKQIRGDYMVTEAERLKADGKQGPGPVWPTKEEADASFNYGIEKTLATVAQQVRETGHSKLSAVFATHNSISVDLGLDLLQRHGLARRSDGNGKLVVSKEIAGRMKDDLTNKIIGSVEVERGLPLVVKSMSYGDLKECLPFLARRATENKAVLEG